VIDKTLKTPEKLEVEYVGEATGKTPRTARAKSNNNIDETKPDSTRFVASPIKNQSSRNQVLE